MLKKIKSKHLLIFIIEIDIQAKKRTLTLIGYNLIYIFHHEMIFTSVYRKFHKLSKNIKYAY